VFSLLSCELIAISLLHPLVAEQLAVLHRAGDPLLLALVAVTARYGGGPDDLHRLALIGGMLAALQAVTIAVAAPRWGAWADRVGRRPLILLSLLMSLAASVLWATTDSFLGLVAARLVLGAGAGSIALVQAAISDRARGAGLVAGLSLAGAAHACGLLLGPLIAAPLVHLGPPVGVGNPCALAAGASQLLAFAIAWRWMPETGQHRHPPAATSGRWGEQADGAGGWKRRLLTVAFAQALIFAMVEATFVFLAAGPVGLPASTVALVLSLMAGASLLMQALQARFAGRLPPAPQLAAAGALTIGVAAATLGGSGLTGSRELLLAGAVILGLGTALAFPAFTALVAGCGDAGHHGLRLGQQRAASAWGRCLGPLLGGLLFAALGAAAPMFVAAVAYCGLGLLLRGWSTSQTTPSSKP
jgi:DHA1 family tetracycline resistance protein-like MFS transporter